MVAKKHQEQRIMVESIFQGLCGEEKTILSVPCIMSSDQDTFFVFFNEIEAAKFSKTTLFNLLSTAKESAPNCKKLVFILRRDTQSNYAQFKRLFDVIDARRMKKCEISQIANVSRMDVILPQYGFFELEI